MLLMVLTGWLERREREALAYLIEENRLLRAQLGGRRLRLTDGDRRRLAGRAQLSPRTFWSFAREFSSFRRQGAATGERR